MIGRKTSAQMPGLVCGHISKVWMEQGGQGRKSRPLVPWSVYLREPIKHKIKVKIKQGKSI